MNQKIRISVVDDEALLRDLVSTSLSRLGHEVKTFPHAEAYIHQFKPQETDLLISDLKMPGRSGVELAEYVLARDPTLAMILMTAYGTVDVAVAAMKLGVKDFIEKPFPIDRLEHVVGRVLEVKNLLSENRRLRTKLSKTHTFIGASPKIKEMLTLVETVAHSHSTILITGESGTGKEMIAHALHMRSTRCDGPFVKLNCAAIPEHLIESELFGHEKGAYTGAIRTRAGKFELADHGTLLLDEIGEMPLTAQSKLLRILQEREVTKVGGDVEVEVDVRVIGTTNRDLEKEVQEGRFREDLYYRLNVIPMEMPALRDRKDDIPLLAQHFIEKYNQENGYTVSGLSDEVLQMLMAHNWPGNVRELENVIQRAVVFARFDQITPIHLKSFRQKNNQPGAPGLEAGVSIAEVEKQLILKTLEACGENRTRAAEMLDISVRTLRNKLHEYKIQDDSSE